MKERESSGSRFLFSIVRIIALHFLFVFSSPEISFEIPFAEYSFHSIPVPSAWRAGRSAKREICKTPSVLWDQSDRFYHTRRRCSTRKTAN
jgi:hypothetical protein